MAEGGGNNRDGNPFSFKQFMKNKDSPGDNDQNKEQNIFDEPDIFSSSGVSSPRRERSQLIVSEDEPVAKKKESKKGSKKDENPFSFKKFLNKDNAQSSSSHSKFYTNGDSLPAPDFASDLPDFVQDHFTPDISHQARSSRAARARTQSDISLPDFALEAQNSPPANDFFPSADAVNNMLGRSSTDRSGRIPNHDLTADTSSNSRVAGLPDFLSEATNLSSNSSNEQHFNSDILLTSRPSTSHDTTSGMDNMHSDFKKVQEENYSLRRELQEANGLAERQTNRVEELLKEIKILQKREAEDSATLENMVLQVEANLQTTTQRAVKAESSVSKLKQEAKSLHATNKVLTAENEMLRNSDPGLAQHHDSTLQISQQLRGSAIIAEQSLKQLLSGVENLKLMADILNSSGKISEEDKEDESKNSNESSHEKK